MGSVIFTFSQTLKSNMKNDPSMTSNSRLEQTVDKILNQTESQILANLKTSLEESQKLLSDSLPKLEQEYDKIISDGNKEAEKLEKQIVGSSDLQSRNKQLILVEDSVKKVFEKAIEQIKNHSDDSGYSNLISVLLDESIKTLGTSDVTVYTNSKDKNVVQSNLSKFPGAELSSETIDCLGGVIVKSKDETMTFDNSIDARIERMKPLLRKAIASKFGLEN